MSRGCQERLTSLMSGAAAARTVKLFADELLDLKGVVEHTLFGAIRHPPLYWKAAENASPADPAAPEMLLGVGAGPDLAFACVGSGERLELSLGRTRPVR